MSKNKTPMTWLEFLENLLSITPRQIEASGRGKIGMMVLVGGQWHSVEEVFYHCSRGDTEAGWLCIVAEPIGAEDEPGLYHGS